MVHEKHIRVRSKSNNQKKNKDSVHDWEKKPLLGEAGEATGVLGDNDPNSLKARTLSCLKDYDIFHNDPSNSINRFTVGVEQMPQWCVHDSFVTQGYRRLTRSWRGCFLSLSYLHNETGNIYSHGLGMKEEQNRLPLCLAKDYPSVEQIIMAVYSNS